jgi:hypothetical protein
MARYEREVTENVGERLFRDKVRDLERIGRLEQEMGKFVAVEGDIDKRA